MRQLLYRQRKGLSTEKQNHRSRVQVGPVTSRSGFNLEQKKTTAEHFGLHWREVIAHEEILRGF